MDRNLPNSLDAEKSVIGSMMWDVDAIHACRGILSAEDFHQPNHGVLFSALVRMAEARREIDLVTLAGFLEEEKSLASVGGQGYLTELVLPISSTANVEHHAKIVKDRSRQRRFIRICENYSSQAYAPMEEGSFMKMMARLEEDLAKAALTREDEKTTRIGDIVDDAIDAINDRNKRRSQVLRTWSGYSTGIWELDDKIDGINRGLQYIIAARPACGKTSLLLQVANSIASEGDDDGVVLFFSYEMTARSLVERLLSTSAEVNLRRPMGKNEWASILREGEVLRHKNILVDEARLDVEGLYAKAVRLSRIYAVRAVCVDYIGIIPGAPGDRDYDRVSAASRKLKQLSVKINCATVVAAQLNRSVERNAGAPKLSDLRDSGNIEQDADTVMFINKREKDGETEIIVSKQRYGSTGSIAVKFNPEITKFSGYEHDEPNLDWEGDFE